MIMKTSGVARPNLGITFGCFGLASFATVISVSLSLFTGFNLGTTLNEKALMAAFGVLTVITAHLLLALSQSATAGTKLAVKGLWLLCMIYVTYSHANFFVSTQKNAGIQRAAEVDLTPVGPAPVRELSAILFAQAKIKGQIARLSRLACGVHCNWQRKKMAILKTEFDALDAKADEVKRWQASRDRRQRLKDSMLDDPVLARVSTTIGVTVAETELIAALLFAVILEGTACLCWYLVFQSRESSVTHPVTMAVMSELGPVCTLTSVDSRSLAEADQKTESDLKIDELVREVKAGRLKLTVNNVRKHFKCAQKKAGELKALAEQQLKVAI